MFLFVLFPSNLSRTITRDSLVASALLQHRVIAVLSKSLEWGLRNVFSLGVVFSPHLALFRPTRSPFLVGVIARCARLHSGPPSPTTQS